jgi:hypothetical protein
MLDGFSGDLWFLSIYIAFVVRLWNQPMPWLDDKWGIWILFLGAVAGFLSHSPQASLADYYRQIHLYFLLGEEGSELDNYLQQRRHYESLPKSDWLGRIFFFNYANYCKSQEKRTPLFQKFLNRWKSLSQPNEAVRQEFLTGSRPLMKYCNMLSFNLRAICLYLSALLDSPWVYFVIELTLFNIMYVYMHRTHERLSLRLTEKL